MKVRFTRPAIRDLRDIGQHTRANWGEEQARRYSASLAARFQWLGSNHTLWRKRSELAEGLYSYKEQQHLILFRQIVDGIEVIRVLHERMDVAGSI